MFRWLLRLTFVLAMAFIALMSAIIIVNRSKPCQCLVYVAFVRDGRSMSELVLIDISTGVKYPLFMQSNIRDITVSPDGQSVYFVQNRPNRLLRFDIYSGTTTTLVSGFIEYPTLSADGNTLAYILDANFGSEANTDTGIYLRQTDSLLSEHLFNLSNTSIAWHPDNRHLTINIWNEDIAQNELWMIDIETGDNQIFLDNISAMAWHQWDSTGTRLAYASDDWVAIYDLQTQNIIPLTDNSRRPVWSVDGQQLAYIEQQDPFGNATINIATRDGQVIRRIMYQGDGFITRANWWQAR